MGHYKFYCFPGRVTFFNKKYKGRAGRFYIHAHRDSSGPLPLLKNECSLIPYVVILVIQHIAGPKITVLVITGPSVHPKNNLKERVMGE